MSWLLFRWFRSDCSIGIIPRLLLSLIPFVLAIACWQYAAHKYELKIAEDGGGAKKVFPTLLQFKDGIKRVAFEKDRNGDYRLWVDTWISFKRAGCALVIATPFIIIGLFMGTFPLWESIFGSFLYFFEKLPMPALTVPFFGVMAAFEFDGLGESAKVAMIVLAVFPAIVQDAYIRTKEIRREYVFKAQSLGASELEIAFSIMFRKILPKMIDTLRLQIKSLIWMLIIVETLGAESGLGYRVFILKRYMAMEIILPYIVWMAILGIIADQLMRLWIRQFDWVDK